MTQIVILQPVSQQAHWLMSLKINQQRNRMSSCIKKIGRLYALSRSADISAMLTLYDWYCQIRQAEGYFDKEIARLSKLIKRKVKDKLTYEPYQKTSYRLRINNPIQVAFYRILHKFDTLMCLSETCLSLLIFKKRRFFAHKTEQYQRAVMRIVTLISQHKQLPTYALHELNSEQSERLLIALHADVMPLLPDTKRQAIQQALDPDGVELGTCIEENDLNQQQAFIGALN